MRLFAAFVAATAHRAGDIFLGGSLFAMVAAKLIVAGYRTFTNFVVAYS
ncbi:MAG: hypothetical protein ABI878_10090 [Acidobacteriota bacterium]